MSASTKKKLRKELASAQLTEKQLAQQKEAKKLKTYTNTFIVIVAVVLVAACCLAVFSLVSSSGILPRTIKAVTIGSHELTNAQLNYFFVDAVNDQYREWEEAYGSMVALGMANNGLVPGKSLSSQDYPFEEGKTWADHFADLAISDAKNAYTMYDAAVASGHTMTEEEKSNMEMLTQMLPFYASAGGYTTTEEYLKSMYGNGADVESYKEYLMVVSLGNSYATKYYTEQSYTQEKINEYDKEHALDFNSYSYSMFYVDRDDFLLCTDPKTEGHVHTAEEYAPALQEAEKYAKQLAESKATNSSAFNTAIAQIELYKEAKLTCNSYSDRLFAEIKEDKQEALNNWISDSNRKVGDMGYVPITTGVADSDEIDGYLVLLFEGMKDNSEKLVNVRHILVEVAETAKQEDKDAAKKKLEDLKAKWQENGGTEEAFIALVKDNSADPGSKENGGLYEDVYPGQMVEAFNDWCFDAARKTGDCDIVETSYGYHLMYYVGASETSFRDYMIENTLRNTDYNAWNEEMNSKVTVTVNNLKYLTLDMAMQVSQ